MADVLTRFNSGKIWDFKGGIHPPEMKSQSNQSPIQQSELAHDFYVPIKQHAGTAGNVLVKEGDYVLKGQPLTQGDGLRTLPVHAPTSGIVKFIGKHVAPHPSGLTEDMIHIQADGLDKWREQFPLEEFFTQPVEQLIDRIYQAGVAGLGGAVFPTAAKIQSAEKKVKLLIINGAECEPYITCDDRLMRDYTDEMIEGIRILRYILRPEKVVIAVEDNKPEAIQAIQQSLHGANDIELRVIPTKYPSGAAKQLIYLLTGMEVPSGGRSYDIGVLMHNVGTAFAIKRAVINDEPLIERVVTLTGDKISEKGNYWVRLGTPVEHLLAQVGYQYDERFPVFAGGPMMGLQLSDLNAPVTKLINCLLAPDHFEYGEPEPEQSCIRCSACSDACPVNLMPQQLYWYARSEDHQKSEEYSLKDCIECGVCAYVCPSHIPLIQYFRQEKAKIWEIKHKQEELLNLTTRGNMAPNVGGVCAHNSTKSGYPSGSVEDRAWFIRSCLARVSGLVYQDKVWTTFKDLSKGANFSVKDVERCVSMDFDMKRKPVRDSFVTVMVEFEGVSYEIANFDTEPFESVAEAKSYHAKRKTCGVLRTMDDWKLFWDKVDCNATGKRILKNGGLEWAKLVSCVMGYRMGVYDIPEMDKRATVQDKLDWLNSLKLCKREFKLNDWKNARKPERQANMLSRVDIADFLDIMGAHSYWRGIE